MSKSNVATYVKTGNFGGFSASEIIDDGSCLLELLENVMQIRFINHSMNEAVPYSLEECCLPSVSR